MRLIVAGTRVQQQNLARQYPDDEVVMVGDALYGLRVSEIVDETFGPYTPADAEWQRAWWDHARCRVDA